MSSQEVSARACGWRLPRPHQLYALTTPQRSTSQPRWVARSRRLRWGWS